MLRCIKLWDKFVFNRSTQKAERRYYDFKGNIVDKPEYGGGFNKSQNNGQKKADGEEEEGGGSYGGGNKPATTDTRPEFKVGTRSSIDSFTESET